MENNSYCDSFYNFIFSQRQVVNDMGDNMKRKWILTTNTDKDRIYITTIDSGNNPVVRIPEIEPYTEPDLDAIRNEEYEKGVQDTKQHLVDAPRTCAYKLGYENGLNDAWEAMRKIANMYSGERKKIFGENFIQKIHSIYSASEAIEKIRQYEQEKEEHNPYEDCIKGYISDLCERHDLPFEQLADVVDRMRRGNDPSK